MRPGMRDPKTFVLCSVIAIVFIAAVLPIYVDFNMKTSIWLAVWCHIRGSSYER